MDKVMTIASECLSKLHDLMKEYQVEFYFKKDDDRIHIASFGDDIFVGILHADYLQELRNEIKRHGGGIIDAEKENLAEKVMEKAGLK